MLKLKYVNRMKNKKYYWSCKYDLYTLYLWENNLNIFFANIWYTI